MKCELCHKAEATEAILRDGNEDDELYVCAACAKAEKAKILSEVLLGQALLQEGIMPSDPVAFALNLRKAMEA